MTIAIISGIFNGLFSIRSVLKTIALITVLRQEKELRSRLLIKFSVRIGLGQAWTGCWRKWIPPAWHNIRKAWPSAISSHVGISENIELVEELICSHESGLHLQKYVLTWKGDGHVTVVCSAKHDLKLKIHKRLSKLLLFDRWRHFISQRCFKQITR